MKLPILKSSLFILLGLLSLNCTQSEKKERVEIKHLDSGKILPEEADLPFSEAVLVDNTLYLSGQIGIIPGTLTLVEGGIGAESKQVMENIKTTLEAHDFNMNDILKCTIMIDDISQWSSFNEIYKTYFEEPYPARSAFGADGLALGAAIEVECIAVLKSD
ncbi:MAG: RidA family protein [Balneola sp.]|nr:MAG: RidA family protein [Balneola sp.]